MKSHEFEVTPLTIAADLANTMTQKTQRRVAEETQTTISYLLDMVELKRDFSRRVLRYLGYRRRVIYVRAN